MSSTVTHKTHPGEPAGTIHEDRLDAMTDADIDRQIAEDPDAAPDVSAWDIAKARIVKPGGTSAS
jgi:hypothetical protein